MIQCLVPALYLQGRVLSLPGTIYVSPPKPPPDIALVAPTAYHLDQAYHSQALSCRHLTCLESRVYPTLPSWLRIAGRLPYSKKVKESKSCLLKGLDTGQEKTQVGFPFNSSTVWSPKRSWESGTLSTPDCCKTSK